MPDPDTRAAKAWTFLALGEGRQFAGNTGYDDLPSRYYRYDSTVPNHARVCARDLAVVRDSDGALGMGWIFAVDESDGEKVRRRCPLCGTTALKARIEKRPRFRCDAGHEFESPREEMLQVVCYRAAYGESWRSLRGLVTAAMLAPFYVSGAQQHAIRELRIEEFGAALKQLPVPIPDDWWDGLL